MPKLIYIKTAAHRDDRLDELIARIRADDTAAYLPFETTPRNSRSRSPATSRRCSPSVSTRPGRTTAPEPDADVRDRRARARPIHATIGREREHRRRARPPRARHRPGRESDRTRRDRQEPARDRDGAAATDLFPDGTYFVPLEDVLEPGLLLPTIAYALGIRDNGEAALEERISRALAAAACCSCSTTSSRSSKPRPVLVRLYERRRRSRASS